MKKQLFFLLLVGSLGSNAFAQKIIINGKETSRPLVWSDFTGTPDKTSSYAAYTWWNLNYRFSGTQVKNDSVRINGFEVTLRLNPEKSWVKKGKETPELLVHEQGHFSIGILCMNEIAETVNNRSFPQNGFQAVLQTLFNTILQKYTAMGEQYDTETAHGNNKEKQEQWNQFFKANKL